MLCSRCGQTSPEGSTFCQACGAPLTAPAPMYQPAYVPQIPRHPVVEAVRSVAASPLFLVAVIFFTVALVFSVLASGESASATYDMLNEMFMDMDVDYVIPSYAGSVLSSGAIIGGIIGAIPTILVAVGLWMVYAAAKKDEPGISTGGLTLLWVMQIISLVGVCVLAGLLALVLLLALLVGGVAAADIPDAESTAALIVIGIGGLIIAGLMALVIVYRVKVMKMVNTVRQTLMTGVPSDKISMFVVVFCFISGGFSVISGLSSLLFATYMTALSTLASAVATILFAVAALKYREAMRQLMMPAPMAYAPAQPEYAPPYVPVPAQPTPYYDPNPTAEIDPVPEQPTEE